MTGLHYLFMAHEALASARCTTFVPAIVHEIGRHWCRAWRGGVAACRSFGKNLPLPHDHTIGDVDKDVGGTYSTRLVRAP
jgi:hypothetical protein